MTTARASRDADRDRIGTHFVRLLDALRVGDDAPIHDLLMRGGWCVCDVQGEGCYRYLEPGAVSDEPWPMQELCPVCAAAARREGEGF